MQSARLLIDGAWISGEGAALDVRDKFTGQVIGTVAGASEAQVHAAVAAARRSFLAHPLDGQLRYQLLARTAALLEARRDESRPSSPPKAACPSPMRPTRSCGRRRRSWYRRKRASAS